jgi:acetyltransferase
VVPEPLTTPRPHRPGPGTVAALTALWTAVTRAGGAVGFTPDSADVEIAAAAREVVEEVRAGRQELLTAGDPLAGVVFLRPGDGPRIAHRADVLRLMVHPDRQGEGLGRALLDAAVARARELGLEQLLLSARGGTGLPAFYARRGWTEVGVFPAALDLGLDERRDEHWFQLRLR